MLLKIIYVYLCMYRYGYCLVTTHYWSNWCSTLHQILHLLEILLMKISILVKYWHYVGNICIEMPLLHKFSFTLEIFALKHSIIIEILTSMKIFAMECQYCKNIDFILKILAMKWQNTSFQYRKKLNTPILWRYCMSILATM